MMRRLTIILKINIFCVFVSLFSFGQNSLCDTTAFYNYLSAGNLSYEKLALNKKLLLTQSGNVTVADSLLLDRAFLFMKTGLPDSSKTSLSRISSTPSFSYKKQQVYTSMLVVNTNWPKLNNYLNQQYKVHDVYYNDVIVSLKMLNRELTGNDNLPVSPPMLEIKSHYQLFVSRSPLLAGVYSAVLPGAGKLYLGYKNQALTAFISNALLAAQAVESYSRAGIKSPRFIITAGIFSVFYAGNIWGSISAAKKRERDFYKQIDYEIYNYHTKHIYSHMY